MVAAAASTRQKKETIRALPTGSFHGFFSTGIDGIEAFLQMERFEREPLQAHVREMLIVVLEPIVRDGASRCPEDRRVLKFLAR
jgi:hypothetical protein